jgi:putative transposase
MARKSCIDVGGAIYHVINRANGRNTIFHSDADYVSFENLLFDTTETHNVLCLAYVIMPNHWHLLIKTFEDGAMARFMRRLTQMHTQNIHMKNRTIGSGHIYQGRYKSHVVNADNYFISALKYIERNSVRAGLCERVEDWQWGSGYQRISNSKRVVHLNADLPVDLPQDYRE